MGKFFARNLEFNSQCSLVKSVGVLATNFVIDNFGKIKAL
jgi:hypothetical protein